jgi:hypothetical protein
MVQLEAAGLTHRRQSFTNPPTTVNFVQLIGMKEQGMKLHEMHKAEIDKSCGDWELLYFDQLHCT